MSGKLRKPLLRSLILTLVVFSAGVFLGIWLEDMRINHIKNRLLEVEVNWNDVRMQSSLMETSCPIALDVNKEFGEKLLKEGEEIERYEKANVMSQEIITQKKKYALLQIQYWLNTVKLRERCNASINTVLYFYSQFDPNVRLQQNIQSRVLVDLIHDCKGKLITFPLPIDLDIASVEILKRRFNVTKAPSLVINETVVLEGLQSRQTLEKYIIC